MSFFGRNPFGGSPFSNPIISNPVPDILSEKIADWLAEFFSHDNSKDRNLEIGDVIGVGRGTYDHYGIYIGHDRVIHYTSENSDISDDNTIMETSFSKFQKGNTKYFILNLEYVEPRKYSKFVDAERQGLLTGSSGLFGSAIRAWQKCQTREVFDAEETVRRAKSRIGENKYSLLFNNCEHFAIWCKTGISQSHQVDDILKGSPKVVMYT